MSEFNNATQKSWKSAVWVWSFCFLCTEKYLHGSVQMNESLARLESPSVSDWGRLVPLAEFVSSHHAWVTEASWSWNTVRWYGSKREEGLKGPGLKRKKQQKKRRGTIVSSASVASQLIDYIGKSQCSLISYRFCPQYWRFWRRMIIIKTW